VALSIGVTAGSQIRVGDEIVKVLEVLRGKAIRVEVDGKQHVITDQQRTEVLPDVFLTYGAPGPNLKEFKGSRLAFEAPKDLKITRLPSEIV
jgi:hypothetical protein